MFPFRKYSSTRFIGFVFFILVFVTVCLYYGSYTGVINIANPTTSGFSSQVSITQPRSLYLKSASSNQYDTKIPAWKSPPKDSWPEIEGEINDQTCPSIYTARTNVNTVEEFSKFEFQPFWLKNREYWDESFEERYQQRKQQWPRPPLKVIIVPHSHNDPGWLKTFEQYYHYQTRNILNHMVDKLQLLKNMTFIWSEMSFFSQWWESAHITKKRVVQQMLQEGRLEIVTGGWVMTDEATSHIYAMLDQLIEGHQWIKNNLGVTVNSGWSVDPFGHGSTVPYLLKSSGVASGTVIQRIHYSWKQWFAKHMMGDFLWRQNWDSVGYTDMFVHNQPFDIYSIKHSCGPHPQICTYFDFRKVVGEFTEYSLKAMPIDEQNVKQKADLLMEQYERTGSLYPHNVILVPLGDDFRYDQDVEWEQQYRNYKRLMDYVNSHKEVYHAEIQFGTPKDYFREVQSRMTEFPTLKGDFFVYSDIFTEGRPAYWSGYFTTRPYWKLLDRELERNLRSAEILYTYGLNKAKQRRHNDTIKVIERNYEKLTKARQNLALFQHHDAITGTSKAFVMRDYALKLMEGIQDSVFLQREVIENLLFENHHSDLPPYRIVVPESDAESYDTTSPKIVTTVTRRRKVVVFNSHAHHRHEVIKMQVDRPNLVITDYLGNPIVHQINPVWNISSNRSPAYDPRQPIEILANRFELLFIVELPPLSVNVFTVSAHHGESDTTSMAVVYCQHCQQNQDVFQRKNIQLGDIQLENRKIRALFDGKTGFLKTITKKDTEKRTFCELTMAAYQSAQFHSGAYLFMPDPNSHETERDILRDYSNQFIVITSGPVASELTVVYKGLLVHSARLYHKDGPLAEGIYIENIIDFGIPPKNRETEMYMRFSSGINNGNPSTFYTDTNGMQMQKRVTVERIGIEGNYYPITTSLYIEDDEQRLSLLVDHSQGASSWQPGYLEVMLERRTLYDDARGMGEGIVDNKKILTKYWLLLEDIEQPRPAEASRPSLLSNYLSNTLLYPANLFLLEEPNSQSQSLNSNQHNTIHYPVQLITKPLPCDIHLLNFRTSTDSLLTQFPSSSALLILHRQGFACNVSPKVKIPNCYLKSVSSHKYSAFRPDTQFGDLQLHSVSQTSLTGIHKLKTFNTLDEVTHVPMNLLTLNVTFTS